MEVKTIKDFGHWCAKVGLWPVRIIDPDEALPIIIHYLNELDIDFASKGVVPLGFDWGCLENKCSGGYNSYNSNKSPDLS